MKIKNDNTIIGKECDKGGVCIIMDAQFYKEKKYDILRDQNTYKQLDKNIDNKKRG